MMKMKEKGNMPEALEFWGRCPRGDRRSCLYTAEEAIVKQRAAPRVCARHIYIFIFDHLMSDKMLEVRLSFYYLLFIRKGGSRSGTGTLASYIFITN